jgi:hypothetical protein
MRLGRWAWATPIAFGDRCSEKSDRTRRSNQRVLQVKPETTEAANMFRNLDVAASRLFG